MRTFTLNDRQVSVQAADDMPLLWVLRDELGLTGTKYGCDARLCGACAVHVDGRLVRACSASLADVDGRTVTTIESVAGDRVGAAVQDAWRRIDVAQCGYCQPGQIMAAVALLRARPQPTDADIDAAMDAQLCRCATYVRVRAAIHEAARMLAA